MLAVSPYHVSNSAEVWEQASADVHRLSLAVQGKDPNLAEAWRHLREPRVSAAPPTLPLLVGAVWERPFWAGCSAPPPSSWPHPTGLSGTVQPEPAGTAGLLPEQPVASPGPSLMASMSLLFRPGGRAERYIDQLGLCRRDPGGASPPVPAQASSGRGTQVKRGFVQALLGGHGSGLQTEESQSCRGFPSGSAGSQKACYVAGWWRKSHTYRCVGAPPCPPRSLG